MGNKIVRKVVILVSIITMVFTGSIALAKIESQTDDSGANIINANVGSIKTSESFPVDLPPPINNTGEIFGRVINAKRQPILSVRVRINNTITPTNSAGEFRFTFLVPGIYTIHYDAPGYIRQIQEQIAVTAGGIIVLPTVIMSPVGGSSNSKSNANLVFYDYFDRPDGLIADDSGNNDSSNKWEVTSQNFYVKNGRGWTNSPVFRVINKNGSFSNFTLQTKMMKMNQGNEPWEGLQLFVRYQNSDNLYAVGLRNDNTIHIKKKVSGVYTTIGQVPFSANRLGYWYRVKVIANGDRIQVFVDEVKYLDVQDSSFSEGKVGIRTDNIETYFDDFIVTQ